MPSKPPPLHVAPALSVPWCVSLPAGSSSRSSWINWPAIVASASVSFALVVCIVAWIVTHPIKSSVASVSPRVVALAWRAQSPTQHTSERIIESPAPPPAPVVATLPAVYRPNRSDRSGHRLLLVEEAPPPLPPPASLQPRGDASSATVQAVPPQSAGETYGTQVLFFNNQEAAAERAELDHKLLFVMHISGNFEDACFT
jgi:hypothetical protein